MTARPTRTVDAELLAKIERLLARTADVPAPPTEDDVRDGREWRMHQCMVTGSLDVDVTRSARLTPTQRAELYAWLAGEHREPEPRRAPSLVEVARGVECCDPAVRSFWRGWRLRWGALAVVAVILAPAFLVAGLGMLWAGASSVIAGCALWSHADSGQGWQTCQRSRR